MKKGIIRLTDGNVRNDHLYLTEVMSLFPPEVVGGANASAEAPEKLEVHSGIGTPVITDIAGDKKIFRKRPWVAEFLQVHELRAGDEIVVEMTGPRRVHVYPRRDRGI